MESIMTYSETRLNGQRYFELYPDKIRIRGKVFLQSDFDTTVPLGNLSPVFEKVRIRGQGFWGGLKLTVISFIALTIMASVSAIDFGSFITVLVACFLVTGLLICAVTFPKIQIYRFKNSAEIIALDIARSGKEKDKFDDFVDNIVACISQCKQQGQQTQN